MLGHWALLLVLWSSPSLHLATSAGVSEDLNRKPADDTRWELSHCQIRWSSEDDTPQFIEKPCNVRREHADGGGFHLQGLGEEDLIKGLRRVTVTVLPSGFAEVRGLTKAGINSRWGRAKARKGQPHCWDGDDFRLCWARNHLKPPRCGLVPLLSTQALLRKSPRSDLDAERLALRLSEGLVADDDAYERIRGDLAAIRSVAKGKTVAKRSWPHETTQGVTLKPKPEVLDALHAGTYRGLDCFNAWYGGRLLPTQPPIDFLFVQFDRWYFGEAIAQVYAQHPDIEWSGPGAFGGAGDDLRLCNENIGGTHRYLFSHGSGDCPSGCIDWVHRGYDVREDGQVTILQPVWKVRGRGLSKDRPSWIHDSCLRAP